MNRFISFLKYNNLAIILIALVFIIGSSVFAAPLAKTSKIIGTDNTLLLSEDLLKFVFDYRVEKIESDDVYYYVTFTHKDLIERDNVWQEEVVENSLKVTRSSLNEDLGLYLARQLAEEQANRLHELTDAKKKAQISGPEKRQEVTEYSGLIGLALNSAGTMFPGYKPVEIKELPSPQSIGADSGQGSANDGIATAYQDYIASHQNLFATTSSTTSSSTISQTLKSATSSDVTGTTTQQ